MNKKPIILIADDDYTFLFLYEQALGREFDLITFRDGEELLRALDHHRPHLIVLDVMMPHLDGFQTCQRIRHRLDGQHTPILMVTALEDVASVQRAFEAGATDFITKPIIWPLLYQRILYILRSSAAFRDLVLRKNLLYHAQKLARVGSLVWDPGDRSVECSLTALEILGIPARSSRAHPWSDLLRQLPRSQRAAMTKGLRALHHRDTPLRIDVSFENQGGETRYVTVSLSKWQTDAGPDRIVGSVHDMTERVRYEQQLSDEKDRAEAANQAKARFLANTSHELRTPLNAIIGFSEMINQELFGEIENKKYLDYARDIHVSGMHLLSIVDDLLEYSRLGTEPSTLYLEKLDICSNISEILRLLEIKNQGLKPGITFSCERPAVNILADARLLRQVMINVLTNALKFTPEHGWIRISVTAAGDGNIRIKVQDNGIGMTDMVKARAFEPFFQGDGDFTRRYGGLGLGLSISKRLIEAQGGHIAIDSAVGAGTTVSISLPEWIPPHGNDGSMASREAKEENDNS